MEYFFKNIITPLCRPRERIFVPWKEGEDAWEVQVRKKIRISTISWSVYVDSFFGVVTFVNEDERNMEIFSKIWKDTSTLKTPMDWLASIMEISQLTRELTMFDLPRNGEPERFCDFIMRFDAVISRMMSKMASPEEMDLCFALKSTIGKFCQERLEDKDVHVLDKLQMNGINRPEIQWNDIKQKYESLFTSRDIEPPRSLVQFQHSMGSELAIDTSDSGSGISSLPIGHHDNTSEISDSGSEAPSLPEDTADNGSETPHLPQAKRRRVDSENELPEWDENWDENQ